MMKNKKIAVIDSRLSEKCKDSLVQRGFDLVLIPENPLYDGPISAHADIFMFVSENHIIIKPEIENIIEKHLFDLDAAVLMSSTNVLNGKIVYPLDCSLNFAKVGKYLIGRKDIADLQILNIAREEGLELINVKQGYAKCNICVVNNNAIITEDKGIAQACRKNNIDVLLLNTNSVNIKGYKYGFIGGSSGTEISVDGNLIYFCGCIEKHPEYDEILTFCRNHNAYPVSLSDEPLYDGGSILIL